MADPSHLKPPPRFALDEEPGDGPDGSKSPWVGAFERVLGDQESVTGSRRPTKAGNRETPALPLGKLRSEKLPQRMQPMDAVNDPRATKVAPSSLQSGSEGSSPSAQAFIPDPMSLKPAGYDNRSNAGRAASSSYETLSDPGRSRSHSKSEESALFTRPGEICSAQSSQVSLVAPARSSPGIQHGAATLALPEKDWLDLDAQAMLKHAGVQRKDSGPSLISMSPDEALVFDQAYVNHAPCVHRLVVRNENSDRSVLVRMESTLSKGLTFMRRKRSAPKHDYEPCAWPTNSLNWARKGGLSPQNLRGWRHVIANLESAGSFVLEPGASTTVYVMLRASAFTPEGEGDLLQPTAFKNPPSPAFQQAARFDRSLDESLASRSQANQLSSSSPVSTPAAIGEQADPFGTDDTVLPATLEAASDAVLASPRSAPELSAATRSEQGSPALKPQHSSFDVRGSITARAWALPRAEAAIPEEPAEAPLSSWSSATSSRPASFYGSTQSSLTATSSSSFSRPDETTGQTKVIPVSARCCRPLMEASLAMSGQPAPSTSSLIEVDFGDALVGQSHTQTLVLRNSSDIDVICQATMEEARNMLQVRPITLLDADDGSTLPFVSADDESVTHDPLVLPRRSRQGIILRLTPQEPCKDYEQVITLTSLHDSSNAIRVVVRANILGVAKDNSLVVMSGDVLDFGDCYGGHWTRQLLVLKNAADVLLDVQFGAQKGVDVTFQLAELAPQGDDEMPDDEDPPPSSVASELSVPSSSDAASRFSSTIDSDSAFGHEAPGGSEARLGPSTTCSELAKTPTHHAQATSAEAEPPKLELSNVGAFSPPSLRDGESGRHTEADEVDASSVASQQGSRPSSPVVQRLPDVSHPSAFGKESLAARLERLGTGPMSEDDRARSLKALSARAASDGDHQSVSTNPLSHASLGLLSRPSSRNRLIDNGRGSEALATDETGSAKSEVTAHSRDSRMGPLPASSSSHAGSNTGGSKHARSTLGRALSGLRNVEQAHSNQLEELVLRPGGEYRVVVSYKPARQNLDPDYTGGRLVEQAFKISLDYARSRSGSTRTKGGRERKSIVCQSRTCTSFISVSPKLIDLGEVQVGTRKSANITVVNHSELTARVDLRFVSKVLSMYKDEVAIPALQSVDLKVESFPRRINESYRKQITVANLLNRHDDQIFEVRSTNVDKQRISFHSLFYRLLTPTGSNFIDFGDVNINSTRIRTFTIENTSGSKLALELSAAHPEDLTLYVKAPPKVAPGSAMSGDGAADAPRVANRYAEVEAADASKIADAEGSRSKPSKPTLKGFDLKERFLETISVDSPAAIRNENTSWRLAQKQSHVTRKDGSLGAASQKKDGTTSKPKVQINLVSALKKGGKGRITLTYGKSMTFKDRTLLRDFEYLDLATGPPVDARRIPAKSKRYNMLEVIATGGKGKHSASAGSGKASKQPAAESKEAGGAPSSAPGSRKEGKAKKDVPKSCAAPPSAKVSSARRLPSPLAKDIRTTGSLKAGKGVSTAQGQPSINAVLKGEKEGRSDTSNRVHFSPALTGRRKAAPVLSDSADVSRMSLEDLLAAVEGQNSTLSTFFLGSVQAEEHFVRTEINLQRELQNAIENERLSPIEVLDIPAGSEKQVIAVYHPSGSTRPHVQGNARKQDSRIFMRLVDFDMGVVRASEEFAGMAELDTDELPVRDLMIRSNTCRSLLELGQPHINFGHMEKSDAKTRKILVQNRSEWALRYCIRKSGSIASGDIKFSGGRYGVVPGYGKREVEFVFSPSMSGAFQEKLVVENVADRDNDQVVVLKANVRKVSNFAVDPSVLDFGAISPGKLSTPESFVLSNTTSKPRSFVIALDQHNLLFQRCIVDVALSIASDGDVKGTLTREEEEEVEHISQKLKIASRKGNLDKVKKYEERLSELGIKPSSPIVPATGDDAVADAGPGDGKTTAGTADVVMGTDLVNKANAPSDAAAFKLKRVSSTVTCALAPSQSKRLVLRIRASAVQSAIRPDQADPSDRGGPEKAGIEEVEVAVKVHEVKNQDETKTVTLRANVEFELAETEAGERPAEAMPADAVIFSPLSD